MALDMLGKDVRFGLRELAKNPLVIGIAVLSLALGIGATTAIFSLMDVFFVRAVPVADPAHVLFVYGTDAKKTGAVASWNYFPISYPNLTDLRAQAKAFSGIASFALLPVNISAGAGAARPERVFGQLVDGNYFDVLGVRAARGRTFLPEEDTTPGTHPVVVVSHSLWQHRLGADPGWVGRKLLLNGRPFTVVGITPPGFQGPTSVGGTELWIPMMMRDQMLANAQGTKQRRWRQFGALGRLRPGVTQARAEQEVATIAHRLEQEYPADNEGRGLTLLPVSQAGLNPNDRASHLRAGLLLMAAVVLVLLIACANVANLLLSRALARGQEIAIRLAHGATRARIVRQLEVETLLLFALGGGCGLLVAVWTRNLLWGIRPPFLSFIDPTIDLSLDRNVLAFNLGLSLLTGLLCGLVPALQGSRRELIARLRQDTVGGGSSQTGMRARQLLVVAQIALSMAALVGAGLFVRSLRNFESVRPGFETRNLLQLTIGLEGQAYSEGQVRGYHRRVVETVEALPGVARASLANSRLMSAAGVMMRTIMRQGIEDVNGKGGTLIRLDTVDVRYFETTGIPLVRGRDLTPQDGPDQPQVAVLNELAARRLWPGESPLGKRFSIFGEPALIEVVGLVKDARSGTVTADPEPMIYMSVRQRFAPGIALVVRTAVPPESLLPVVRRAVQDLDPNLPLVDLEPIAQSLRGSLWGPRAGAALLSAFGLLALVMAAVGLYGVVAYSVEQRRRELAIRLALGAHRADIFLLILRQTAKLVGSGLALGVLVALAFTRTLGSFLFGIGTADPPTFALILLLLGAVALAASLVPARRATRVQPAVVLRSV
jgi:predicted permease